MDKALVQNVLTAVVTAVVLGIGAFVMGVFEKGTDAISEDQIRAVIEEVMVTDAGKTYKARLAEVDIELAVVETRLGKATDDIDDLEDMLGELVSP
jgi:hypothetical protein